jgi:integrase
MAAAATIRSAHYVPLMGHALAPDTHDKYTKALQRFVAFCDERAVHVRTVRDVDRHLARFVQHLFDTAQPFGVASCAVYGLQHYAPWAGKGLEAAKMALAGWKRLRPSVSHPPLTWELTCLLAAWMAAHGQHDAGLALLLGFDCYLRIGEILGLKVGDVAVNDDARLGAAYRGVMIRLARTKTGANQAVSVESADVSRLLAEHVRAKSDRAAPVFDVARHAFYDLFHRACAAFGLDGYGYSPHSLRHGGATRHHLQGRPITDIQFRGRWSSSKSVRTYIQSGRALLLVTDVDREVFELAKDCAKVVRLLFQWLPHARRRRSECSNLIGRLFRERPETLHCSGTTVSTHSGSSSSSPVRL